MRKNVLTGGPYSGKTKTIAALEQLGYRTIPETAIEIIQANPGLRAVNQSAFQKLVISAQIEREATIEPNGNRPIFLDRGLIDSIAYCTLRGISQPAGLHDACKATDYHAIFALETLSNYDQRAETGRTSSEEVSHRTYTLLVQAYERYGYTVTTVPERPIEERIEFILQVLERSA